MSSNPILRDDCTVVAIIAGPSLAYTKCGDDKWNEIPSTRYFTDIIFYEGRLYGLTFDAQLILIEIGSSNPQVIQTLSAPKLDDTRYELHLVDSRICLLMVQCSEQKDIPRRSSRFDVDLYDFRAGQWISNLIDIGYNILFVGYNNCVSISLKGCSTPMGLRANNIYFFNYRRDVFNEIVHMKVFDLKTTKIEEIPNFINSSPITPIWFTPITY